MRLRFFVPAFFLLMCARVSAETIVFSANAMTGQAGNSSTTTTLSGNAYVKTQSMEIQADVLELSGDDYRFIKAQGHIDGKNLETNMTFTCDSLSYDRVTKIADLRGNVDFQDVENDVRAQAQIIVYNQNDETAVMQVKVSLTQKDNVCTGAYALYYKTTQILELSGNAQIRQKDDVFRAQHITLDMDTQEITLGGNVRGSVSESKSEAKKLDDSGSGSEENADDSGADFSALSDDSPGNSDEDAADDETEAEKSDGNAEVTGDGQ